MSKILEEKLDKLTEEVTGLKDNMGQNNVQMAVLAEQMKIHIKGVADNHDEIMQVRKDLKPVEDHVKFIQGLMKLLLWLGTIGGSFLGALKYFGE